MTEDPKTTAPKILFLDIDGPMIPYRAMLLEGQTRVMTLFDPIAVGIINHLCKEYGWKIVLHTSWVKIEGGQYTKDHCVKQGIKAEHFHEDAWCDEYINWRYTRVAEWLARHPEVKTYVIVDDEPFAPDQHDIEIPYPDDIVDHIVLVNYYQGLLFSTYNEIRSKEHLVGE
jgi:hypothetical protein